MSNKSNKNVVSIRLMSGGHSFSPSSIENIVEQDVQLDVEVVTAKTTLVPSAMFDKSRATDYLAFVGLAPNADEVTVFSVEVDDKIAVMALNKECYSHLVQMFGNNLSFTSPIVNDHAPKMGALVELVDSVLYVRIFNGGMLFGEAIHVENDADIVYAFETIDRVYHIYNMHVRARGDVNRIMKCCKNCFTDIEIVS